MITHAQTPPNPFGEVEEVIEEIQDQVPPPNPFGGAEEAIEEVQVQVPPQTTQDTVGATIKFFTEKQEQVFSLFPKVLDSSGYIFLSVIAIFFTLSFFIYARRFKKLLIIAQENNKTLKDVSVSLYLQQQVVEYRLLLSELNTTVIAIEKTNARTQLYNHLNSVCCEICETKDSYLALQLAHSFFTKIQSRYLKLPQMPEGILYFKFIGKILVQAKGQVEDRVLLKEIRKNYKKTITAQKELEKEVITDFTTDSKKEKKKWNLPFRIGKK